MAEDVNLGMSRAEEALGLPWREDLSDFRSRCQATPSSLTTIYMAIILRALEAEPSLTFGAAWKRVQAHYYAPEPLPNYDAFVDAWDWLQRLHRGSQIITDDEPIGVSASQIPDKFRVVLPNSMLPEDDSSDAETAMSAAVSVILTAASPSEATFGAALGFLTGMMTVEDEEVDPTWRLWLEDAVMLLRSSALS